MGQFTTTFHGGLFRRLFKGASGTSLHANGSKCSPVKHAKVKLLRWAVFHLSAGLHPLSSLRNKSLRDAAALFPYPLAKPPLSSTTFSGGSNDRVFSVILVFDFNCVYIYCGELGYLKSYLAVFSPWIFHSQLIFRGSRVLRVV